MRASPMAGSTSSSSNSFDSSASQSSSTTSIDQTTQRTQLRTLKPKASANNMPDNLKPPPPTGGGATNETGSGSYSSNSTSNSYNKRYKFGLTNHFLTMPVSDSAEDQARRVQTYQRELDNLRKRHASKRKQESNSKQVIDLNPDKGLKRTRGQRGASASNLHDQMTFQAVIMSDDECDLSVLAGSSSPDANSLLSEVDDDEDDELGVWRGQSDLLASSRHTNGQLSSDGDSSSRPLTGKANKTPAVMMHHHRHQTRPAGDAGLDAVQCNSKAADDYYLPSPAHHNHHHHQHHHRHQLIRAGGDKNLTGSASNGHLLDSTASSSLSSLHHQQHHQHHLKKKRKLNGDPEDCASNGLLLKFSSIMYATFLVILGCILHVSELKQKSRNSSDHIYTIVVASIGILWLIFLQSDLQRYKKYASKFILLESILNDHTSQQRQDGLLTVDPTGQSISSSSASLVNDRMSMNTEVIFKKTAYKMYQHQAAQPKLRQYARDELASDSNHVGLRPASAYGRPTSRPNYHSATDCASGSILGDRIELSSSSSPAAAQLVPAYKFLHGKMGANFYLKCGMAAFCFGHVIHEGLRFGQQVYFFATSNAACRDSAALVAHLVTPLYSFYQLFMMFKYSNLVINRHKVLARFGLMHIIGTCVTFWFRTILEEAFEDFVHKMDYFKSQNKPIKQYLDPTSLLQMSPQFERSATPNQMPTTTTTTSTTSTAASGLVGLLDWLNSVTSSDDSPSSPSVSSQLNQSSARPTPRALPWEGGNQLIPGQNMSLAQSAALLALMSSPLSATITPQLVRHLPDSYHCAQNTLLTTKSMNALPYLYPFTIEYNLLIAATFLSLYFNIGKVGSSARRGAACVPALCKPPGGDQYHRLGPASCGLSFVGSQPDLAHELEMSKASDVHVDQPRHQHLNLVGSNPNHHNHHLGLNYQQQQQQQHPMQQPGGEYKSNFVVNADCHAANKGLFLGFFVLLVTLVTIVIFFVTISKPSHVQLGIKINLIQEATLTSLILVVTLAGYRQIMRLTRNPFIKDKVTTDDVLMLIPLPFFFIHSLLSFRAETATLYSSHAQHQQQQQQQQQALVDGQLALLSQPRAPRDTLHLEAAEMAARRLNVAGSEGLRAANGGGLGSSSGSFLAPGGELMLVNKTQRANAIDRTNNPTRLLAALSSRRQTNATTPTVSPNVSTSHHDDHQTGPSKRPAKSIDRFKLLTIVLNLAVMLEVLVQTNFIIDGLRRCSESRLLRFKKPGRELITFAILLNITYWIVATFETKSVEQYKTEIDYYGPLPYMFISHTTLPVMLFYRYHSSVCLAEIWNRAYKPPKRR